MPALWAMHRFLIFEADRALGGLRRERISSVEDLGSGRSTRAVLGVVGARGVSASKLLATLVWTAVKENPAAKIKRLAAAAKDEKAPAEKYTVRLMGADAARLEERAQARGVTPSGTLRR